MNQNIISKLNLEPRISDMKRENLSERDIAQTLSKESNQTITRSAVHRYLSANVRLCQEVVEVNNKMKVKVAEAELDTIEARHELIDKIRDLGDKAESNGDLKTALYAVSQSLAALESLDKRLGKLTETPGVHVSLQITSQMNELTAIIAGEQCPTCKTQKIGRLHEIAGK
jgi:predicted transcriptional regulator